MMATTSSTPIDFDVTREPMTSRVIELIAIGLLLSMFVLLAVLGNTLVIVAVVTDPTLRKASNYFVVSLALADTLVAATVMSFAVVNDLAGWWMLGPIFCSVWLSSDVMYCTASILSLCLISLDRYAHVRSSFQYDRLMSHRVALASVLIVWILSALISFLPIHLGLHEDPMAPVVVVTVPTTRAEVGAAFYVQEGEEGAETRWVEDDVGVGPVNSDDDTENVQHGGASSTHENATIITGSIRKRSNNQFSTSGSAICLLRLNSTYAIVSSTVSFFVPCVVMIGAYCQLYRYARRHAHNIRLTVVDLTPSATNPTTISASNDNGHNNGAKISRRPAQFHGGDVKKRAFRLENHKAAFTLGVIMGVFLICWTPFFTVNVVDAVCGGCVPPLFFTVFTWLGYVNSSLNPLIYSIFNQDFRRAFRRILFYTCRELHHVDVRRGSPLGSAVHQVIVTSSCTTPTEYLPVPSHGRSKQGSCEEMLNVGKEQATGSSQGLFLDVRSSSF